MREPEAVLAVPLTHSPARDTCGAAIVLIVMAKRRVIFLDFIMRRDQDAVSETSVCDYFDRRNEVSTTRVSGWVKNSMRGLTA